MVIWVPTGYVIRNYTHTRTHSGKLYNYGNLHVHTNTRNNFKSKYIDSVMSFFIKLPSGWCTDVPLRYLGGFPFSFLIWFLLYNPRNVLGLVWKEKLDYTHFINTAGIVSKRGTPQKIGRVAKNCKNYQKEMKTNPRNRDVFLGLEMFLGLLVFIHTKFLGLPN